MESQSLKVARHSSNIEPTSPTSSYLLDAHYGIIRKLYIDENKTLVEVMKVMESSYGLHVSKNMYKKKIRQWNMFKQNNTGPLTPSKTFKEPESLKIRNYHFVAMKVKPTANRSARARVVAASHAAIIRNRLLNQDIREIPPPSQLKLSEEMFHAIRSFTAQRIELRLHPEGSNELDLVSWKTVPVERRRTLLSPNSLRLFGYVGDNAIELFRSGHISASMASLEHMLQGCENMVRDSHYSTISALGQLLVDMWDVKMYSAIPIMLKQVSCMATIYYGNRHPLAVLSRNLVQLLDADGSYIEPIMKLYADTAEEILGKDDHYAFMARSYHYRVVFTILMNKYGPSSVKALSEKVKTMVRSFPVNEELIAFRYGLVGTAVGILNGTGQHEEAEKLFRSTIFVDVDLDHIHYTPNPYLHPTSYLQEFIALSRSFIGQKKFELAKKVLKQIIQQFKDIHGDDWPGTIEAIRQYAICLAREDLKDEAEATHAEIEKNLLPYMLKAKSESQILVQDLEDAQDQSPPHWEDKKAKEDKKPHD